MVITQHQVNEICFQLDKTEGRSVTHREVRKELGSKGSFSTLSPMIQKWEKDKIEAIKATYQLSEEVRQVLLADVSRAMKKMKADMQQMIDQKESRLNDMQAILSDTESKVAVLAERLTQAQETATKANGAAEEARHQAAKLGEEKEAWQTQYHEAATKLAVMTNRQETLQQQYDTLCPPKGEKPKEGK